jgi:hypothetical protein
MPFITSVGIEGIQSYKRPTGRVLCLHVDSMAGEPARREPHRIVQLTDLQVVSAQRRTAQSQGVQRTCRLRPQGSFAL